MATIKKNKFLYRKIEEPNVNFKYIATNNTCDLCCRKNNEFIAYQVSKSRFFGIIKPKCILICQSCISKQFRNFKKSIKTPI